ncbi:hypothetical protein OTSUT76_1364 [Orientia tsutsugamushi str. UT76]|nr:hypothetical protein OTSUT76_1364 [Orientia tsutsugamushi str. UT76]
MIKNCLRVINIHVAQALANELRTTDQANRDNCGFDNVEKSNKEKYLTQIETSANLSKESQLKHKIAGSFEAAMAYQILTSCSFGPAVRTRFFVKLLKNITLTECDDQRYYKLYKMYMDTKFKTYKLHNLSNSKLFHRNKSMRKSIS